MTKTMTWMNYHDKPASPNASHYYPQVKLKVEDGILNRQVRGPYDGIITDYTGDRASYTTDLHTFKLLLVVVATDDADYMTADIGDFYLGSVL